MMRRIPLWLTLVPLVVAGVLYGVLWRGWAEEFRAELTPWLAGAPAITGFPYRLEADANAPRLSRGEVVKLEASAARARINRGPWQPELTVLQLQTLRASARVSPAISARLEGNTAITSINWGEGRLRRLSSVVQAARLTLGQFPSGTPGGTMGGINLPITADTLELHLREREGDPVPDTSPTQAARGQLVLSGTRLRLGKGDALTMAAEVLATGPARLTGYDLWAGTGTLEITRLTLSDAHGEVVSARATLAPKGRDELRLAGTITTVCPLTISGSAATEYRLRVPVRVAISGTPEALILDPLSEDISRRPRRTKEPACPKLFG